MTSPDGSAAARRRARAARPVRIFEPGSEPSDGMSDRTAPEARLAVMQPLAVDAWATGGRPLPDGG